jgi:GFO/IDH/MocA oxidoreductase family protein
MRTWLCLSVLAAMPTMAADLRLGIVGTDTSHVIAFTKVLNDPSTPGHVAGARVVAAYKGGTDLPQSATRVDKFAAELQSKWNVEFVPDIPTLCSKVDAILLESVDGRIHLKEAKQIIAARKPMFIDKPLAATLEDAREIARLAAEAGVPWFSSSSSRFGGIAKAMKHADATGVLTWGPGPLDSNLPLDLAWYAIHPLELLYTLMGPGCEEVTRISGGTEELLIGRWKDGRIGTVRALRAAGSSGAVVYRPKQVMQSDPSMEGGYEDLLEEVVKFFQTKQPPVSNAETIEIFAFMDAAKRSKEEGGKPARLR